MNNKASQFASKLAGLVSLAIAGRRYTVKIMKKFTLLLVLISSFVFAGDPFKEFPGQYYFSTDSDNGVSEMSFRIMGEAGKKMYEGIDQIPERDDCDLSNNLIKYLGNIQCHYNPDDESHICYFGININTGGFGRGISC